MKKILITLLLFSSLILANAQSNYKAGYVITNNNDTLKGLIDFRSDEANAKICKFKTSETAEEQRLQPGEIKAFRFIDEGKYYVSRAASIQDKAENLFIEYLVQGKVNMYYYKQGSENEYYFLEKEDGTLHPFTKKADEIVQNKKVTDNKYKGVLLYLLQDCPPINNKIEKTGFDRESMVELAKEYHAEMCLPGEECIVFENDYKKNFVVFKLSLYAGVFIKNYETTVGISFPDKDKLKNSIAPAIGAQLNVSNPRISKSLSFLLDASFSSFKYDDRGVGNNGNRRFKYSANIVNLTLGGRYTLQASKHIRPSVEVGVLSFSYVFNRSSQLWDYYGRPDEVINWANLSSIGYEAGIGLDYVFNKQNAIFCRVDYNSVSGSLTTLKLKLGYTF
ncbi:hypothetical protein [Viscerimonas tarda]